MMISGTSAESTLPNHGKVKQLFCLATLSRLLILLGIQLALLSSCTKAVPTLTSLNSEVDGIQLQASKPTFYSNSGNLEITGACDARVTSLKAKVLDADMKPLTDLVPLKDLLDPQSVSNLDCGGRALKFNFAKQFLAIADSTMADNEVAIRHIWVEGTTEFGSKPQAWIQVKFTKDTVAPIVTVDPSLSLQTINLVQSSTYALRGTCESGLEVRVTYGNPTIETKVPCASATYNAPIDLNAQPDGNVTFHVEQKDAADNSSASLNFVALKDIVPPVFTVESVSPKVVNKNNKSAITFSVRCEAGLSAVVESPVQYANPASAIVCAGTAGQTVTVNKIYDATPLPDSAEPIPFVLSMTDGVGNKTSANTSLTSKDTIAGTISLVLLRAATNRYQIASGGCTTGQGDVRVTFSQGAKTATRVISCAGGAWVDSQYDVSTLGATNGAVTVTAIQRDSSQNDSNTAQQNFTYDTVAPTGTISLTGAQTTINIAKSQVLQTIAGTCEYPSNLRLAITPETAAVSNLTSTCSSGGTWSANVNFASLNTSTSSVTYTLTVIDAADNEQATLASSSVDLIAPVLAISQLGYASSNGIYYANSANKSAVSFFGLCEGALVTRLKIQTGTGTDTVASLACGGAVVSGSFSATTYADGAYQAYLEQTDAAGNVGTSPFKNFNKDTVAPPAPTSLANLQKSSSTDLTHTPTFQIISGADSGAGASSIWKYEAKAYDLSGAVLATDTLTQPSGVLSYSSFEKESTYRLEVAVRDFANNISAPYSDTWDYCFYRTISFGPTASVSPNVNEPMNATFKIPRACSQGNISIIAVGEGGRSPGGAFDGVNAEGAGALSAALFSGSSLAGRTLNIDFGGAGLGGRYAAGINNNAGGRYAWVEDSSDASRARVVAGGGGGRAGTALDAQYANKPGLGGDSGLGGGNCEDDFSQYRQYCGRNANADSNGSAGVAGKAGTCMINTAPESGLSGLLANASRGKGGNAANNGYAGIVERASGGGGGGFGGGGAGSNGLTTDCFGRSGGGGGSDVSGSALFSASKSAINKIAGINASYPKVTIVLGLPQTPCPTADWIYVPGGTYSTNAIAGRADAGFCVARAEMYSPGLAGIQAAPANNRAPTRGLKFSEAVSSCSAIATGSNYKLVTNDQWQTLALITHWNSENWMRGKVGYTLTNDNKMATGQLNNVGSLTVPDDDVNPCAYTTNSNCSLTSWNANKRALSLGNNAYIWDLNSNGAEWVNVTRTLRTVSDYGSQPVIGLTMLTSAPFNDARIHLGPTLEYTSLVGKGGSAFGLGFANMNYSTGNNGLLRGGASESTDESALGVFSSDFSNNKNASLPKAAFRCVYEPSAPGF